MAGGHPSTGGSKAPRAIPSSRVGPLPSETSFKHLTDLSAPHVESFNFMLDEGLQLAVANIPPREFKVASGETVKIWIENANIEQPTKQGDSGAVDQRLLPSECRERGMTYAAPLNATIVKQVDDEEPVKLNCKLGDVPIMVRSSRCYLAKMNSTNLIRHNEEASEFGGYFICNGIERIIRMLQIPKRNYPMAITRGAYTNRGPLYSNKGIVIRCVRPDQSSVTLTLHYLNDGSATVRFTVRKQEFFLPVVMILKALVETSDREIYERVIAGDTSNTYLSDRVLMLLRDAKRYESHLHSRDSALAYLGARFRTVLDIPARLTDIEVGQFLLDSFVLVHIPADSPRDKFNLLILMLRKLYAFVAGSILEDNADSLANQELLLSGHLLLMFLKEKLYELTVGIQESIMKDDTQYTRLIANRNRALAKNDNAPIPRSLQNASAINPRDNTYFRKIVDRQPPIGRKMYTLLATGNMVSSSGLDLMQVSGYTVVADKLNFFRFTTHFRSVHRGQFFTEMKTTTVRKLLPENWGFLCPVHTPDGGPCGLLNHMAEPATVVAHPVSSRDFARASGQSADQSPSQLTMRASLEALLTSLGMIPHAATNGVIPATHLPVLLDGVLLGGAPPHAAFAISRALRIAKALVGNVAAVVDGVEGPPEPEQLENVRALRRSALLGLTSIPGQTQGTGLPTHASLHGEKFDPAADSPAAEVIQALRALGAAAVVPPSMEVAFVPPSWWDVHVDPFVPPQEAAARAAKCSQLQDALVSQSQKDKKDKKVKQEGTGLPTDDDPEPPTKLVGLYSGLFLHTAPQRIVRPVLQLDTGLVELVSPLEQQFLDIACMPEDFADILNEDLDTQEGDEREKKGDEKEKKKKKGEKAIDALVSTQGAQVEGNPIYTHIELSAAAMLSELASLTPFSDMNQSPRNMYQCQMSKQTMGTPLHSWNHRADTKHYTIQNPQAPIVQNRNQSFYGMDEYPNGCNACVAVIAYTGYDMEDACIINKSSFERGFGWGYVYKCYEVDLQKDRPAADIGRYVFHNTYVRGEGPVKNVRKHVSGEPSAVPSRPEVGQLIFPDLDADGLPAVGTLLKEGDAFYSFLDTTTSSHQVARHRDLEPAYVDEIRILAPTSSATGTGAAYQGVQRVSIKLRYDRRPVVGDKFSSRHGQKGVLSYLWPHENMPFSDQGMSPDVIINPHAFPSRMTIGMLVESMAGKAGALYGKFQDSTPFRFNEENRAVDYFGQQLAAAGYNYYGTETFYSGVTGEPLHCEIYYGVVYYQRLRHMVKDKAQVRSTGPLNALTRQPVKGRKKGGGIRFGEMERDSLIAHGAAFLLHDRLMNSSDRHVGLVCKGCGSMISTYSVPASATSISGSEGFGAAATQRNATFFNLGGQDATQVVKGRRQPMCSACGNGDAIVPIAIPYVFRYLANELAGMNIRIKLNVGEGPFLEVNELTGRA